MMMADYYRTTAINEYTYRITSPEGVFMDLFVGREKALLFDTGFGFGDLRSTVRALTDKPLIIINSHGHFDHICGNYQFTDSKVYIHDQDIALAAVHNSASRRALVADNALKFMDYTSGCRRNILPEDFSRQDYIDADLPVYWPLQEGHVFDLGGCRLETVNFKGHTHGGIAVWDKVADAIHVGDAINSFLFLFGSGSDRLHDYIEALKKAQSLAFKKFYVSHQFEARSIDQIDELLQTAMAADYAQGIPFVPAFALEKINARICLRNGYSMSDFGKQGFAAIVIGEENIVSINSSTSAVHDTYSDFQYLK